MAYPGLIIKTHERTWRLSGGLFNQPRQPAATGAAKAPVILLLFYNCTVVGATNMPVILFNVLFTCHLPLDIPSPPCYHIIMSSYDHISTRSIRARYYAVTFLIWFSTALPLALTVLLMRARGLSLSQIGFVMGAYSLIIVLLEVPTGGLADAVGRVRVALVAHALAAVSSLALLPAFSFPAFLGAMVLYGVSRALSSGALDAWFVDALQAADPDVDLQPALAGAEIVALLALGLGTILGSALPRLFPALPADGTAVLTPLAIPLVAALGVRLLLLPAIALFIREARPTGGASWREGFRAVPALVRDAAALSRANNRLVLLMAASFVAGFALLGLESFWQPFFAALPGTTRSDGATNTVLFGVIMAGNFLASMAGNFIAGPLGRRLDRRYALLGALSRLLQGSFMLALAASTALIPAAAAFWLAYLSAGVGNSPHATLVNDEIPAARRSAMLSVQSLAFYAGSFLGGAGLGWLADRWSIGAAWAVAGGLVVVSLAFYLLVDRSRRDVPLERLRLIQDLTGGRPKES
jgi:MFS family permease